MNFLPIIILLFLYMKKDSLKGVFDSIDIDEIKETLKELGIKSEILDFLSNETINDITSGNFKAILPLIPTFLSLFNKDTKFTENTTTYYNSYEELSPIKDIASENITSTLGNYFK